MSRARWIDAAGAGMLVVLVALALAALGMLTPWERMP